MALPVLAFAQPPQVPTYPIDPEVRSTLDETVATEAVPANAPTLVPRQVSQYAANGYGLWNWSTPGCRSSNPTC